MYAALCIYIPDYFVTQVDHIFLQFMWGQGKRSKVRRDVIINDKSLGGAKMIDFKIWFSL